MNLEVARQTLIEHSHSIKNGSFPTVSNAESKLTNPVCGDHVELKIRFIDNQLIDIGYKTKACAICTASASLVTENLRDHSFDKIMGLMELFQQSIQGPLHLPWPSELESFNCFEHLRVNPSRRMCALLPWLTLKKSLLTFEKLP